jgi:hypothetical protein
MANERGQRDTWMKFIAPGENPLGMVAQTPDETMINYRGGESVPGSETDPRSLQAEQSYIEVGAYRRKRRGVQSDPT